MGSRMRSLVAWSRSFVDEEILLAVNTGPDQSTAAWVTIDNDLHRAGDRLSCLYSTNSTDIGSTAAAEARNGKAIRISVPAGGFVVYK